MKKATRSITHCPDCGEELIGDGYTSAIQCPNYEGETYEPDSVITFCNGGSND